jgi:UDP-glucose 4-epimerase
VLLTNKRWLFLGGAGYIGSHVLREFLNVGATCVVLDNLITGKLERLPGSVIFVNGDVTDEATISRVCAQFEITGVVHLAAYMQARESLIDPIKYWGNNLGASLALARVLENTMINQIIFSSSCSVYGNAQDVTEESILNPISPYAMTKVASEQVLSQSATTNEIQLIILRYFNVIGCGEFSNSFDHGSQTILPSTARKILAGKPPLIFGGDLPTPDGTALRDYLDVRDLAKAHLVAACSQDTENVVTINVTSGQAVSVKEIIDLLLEISGSSVLPLLAPANIGDPIEVWAKESPRLKTLGWEPRYSLRESIQSFWEAFRNSEQ